jgi:hypothetical protein
MDNALKEPSKELADRTVNLDKFQHEAFDVYHNWLLTGKMHCKGKPADHTEASDITFALYSELRTLETLLDLEHYLLDTAFTDTVSDAILQCCQELQSHGATLTNSYGLSFYKVLPPGSPGRSMIANLVAWTTSFDELDGLKDGYLDNEPYSDKKPSNYLMDVLHAVARRCLSPSTSISPLQEPETSCKYHSHGDETVCYRKKKTEYAAH